MYIFTDVYITYINIVIYIYIHMYIYIYTYIYTYLILVSYHIIAYHTIIIRYHTCIDTMQMSCRCTRIGDSDTVEARVRPCLSSRPQRCWSTKSSIWTRLRQFHGNGRSTNLVDNWKSLSCYVKQSSCFVRFCSLTFYVSVFPNLTDKR